MYIPKFHIYSVSIAAMNQPKYVSKTDHLPSNFFDSPRLSKNTFELPDGYVLNTHPEIFEEYLSPSSLPFLTLAGIVVFFPAVGIPTEN